MKILNTFIVLLFVSLSFNSIAQDNNWDSKTWDLGNFTEIDLEGGFHVFLIQGDKNSITVRASDLDVFDDLNVRNEEEYLRLSVDRKPFDFERVNLYITFRDLNKMIIEGGVKLKTKGYLNLNDFTMQVQGGAKIELNIKAENVKITGEGGVLFELDGVAETLDVKVSGAGHVDASELKTRDVTFKIEGVGTGSVYATETLYAKIEGVGKVKYRGNPKVTKDIEGLGTVSAD